MDIGFSPEKSCLGGLAGAAEEAVAVSEVRGWVWQREGMLDLVTAELDDKFY